MDADMQQLRLTEPELLASIPEKSDQFRWYAETWRSGAAMRGWRTSPASTAAWTESWRFETPSVG